MQLSLTCSAERYGVVPTTTKPESPTLALVKRPCAHQKQVVNQTYGACQHVSLTVTHKQLMTQGDASNTWKQQLIKAAAHLGRVYKHNAAGAAAL